MKIKLLLTATAVSAAMLTSAANADELTIMSWGGAYTISQTEAYYKPWMAATGHKINSVDSDCKHDDHDNLRGKRLGALED